MSKLSIDQRKIRDLLGNDKSSFIIPPYQRQYAWGERECSRLWDDLFEFTIPDGDQSNFDNNKDEYFLGPIVTFPNNEKQEVIDGHQRLVTLTLLLRAFYVYCSEKNNNIANTACKNIEQCIWDTNEAEEPDKNSCKIDIKVITDDTLREFQEILRTGIVLKTQKSQYAENYRFFQKKIDEFAADDTKGDFLYMPIRIMKNCILLPIEADSQDTALQIFSTLNDRGKPLSDSDIFKAQFYEYYEKQTPNRKEEFITSWKKLEALCMEIFPTSNGTSVDEIFSRYMYYERAKQGIKAQTTESLRKFYEKNSYALLKKDETFKNIIDLAVFWQDVAEQTERFSEDVLKRLFVLNYAPTDIWTNIVSVYYLQNRNSEGILDDEKFCSFLSKITAFILGYSLSSKRSSDFRAPIYSEMVNIVNNAAVEFEKYQFALERLRIAFKNYEFTDRKNLTKFMLVWWTFENEKQILLPISQELNFDSFIPKKNLEKYGTKGLALFEALGNKYVSIREKSRKRSVTEQVWFLHHGSLTGQDAKIKDLYNVPFAKFHKNDIAKRDDLMLETFIKYLRKNDLIQ